MNISISGELGDTTLLFPSLKALGGGSIYGVNRPWTRPGFDKRILALKRLGESQSYINYIGPHQGERIDLDASPFRRHGLLTGQTIVDRIARFCRAKVEYSTPWLEVEPDPRSMNRIVINQCSRWESWYFPWKKLVQTFGNDLLFVGLPEEHKAFCDAYGKVPYERTNDLYDVARLIKGSTLFIGNQSSCNAIAEGLHHNKILAVCLYACDCLFKRDNALYCVDGSLRFSALGKVFESEPAPLTPVFGDIDRVACLARTREAMLEKGIV